MDLHWKATLLLVFLRHPSPSLTTSEMLFVQKEGNKQQSYSSQLQALALQQNFIY